MIKKLVIWDFDGVIADSEKIWLKHRQEELNLQHNINWSFNTTNYYIGGMSDKNKREVLDNLGIVTNDCFWQKVMKRDNQFMDECGLEVFDGVEDILKSLDKYCVATGGVFSKTLKKLKAINMWGVYFDESNVFTVDMVEKGKPAPDLFLYTAKKMGEDPKNCLVIEDSIVGMKAGISAGMDVIAFLGSQIYQNEKYIQQVKDLGIKNIFFDMNDVKEFLLKN